MGSPQFLSLRAAHLGTWKYLDKSSTFGYNYCMDEDDERHGTVNGYNNLRCRCDKCRQAWAEYIRERRAKAAA